MAVTDGEAAHECAGRAAAFTDLGVRLLGADGATRIISFFSVGMILARARSFASLNMAATLRCSAAVDAVQGDRLIVLRSRRQHAAATAGHRHQPLADRYAKLRTALPDACRTT